MTGLKASKACWRLVAKFYRQKYHGRLQKIENQRKRLVQLEASIIGVRSYNKQLTEKLEVLERQVEEFKPAFVLQQIRAGNVTEVND